VERHPTNRNVLVDRMPCGCRLEIPMQPAGRIRGVPNRRRVGLSREVRGGTRWNDVQAFLGLLVQCDQHRSQWGAEDDEEQED
jgi:hypothetical protein